MLDKSEPAGILSPLPKRRFRQQHSLSLLVYSTPLPGLRHDNLAAKCQSPHCLPHLTCSLAFLRKKGMCHWTTNASLRHPPKSRRCTAQEKIQILRSSSRCVRCINTLTATLTGNDAPINTKVPPIRCATPHDLT